MHRTKTATYRSTINCALLILCVLVGVVWTYKEKFNIVMLHPFFSKPEIEISLWYYLYHLGDRICHVLFGIFAVRVSRMDHRQKVVAMGVLVYFSIDLLLFFPYYNQVAYDLVYVSTPLITIFIMAFDNPTVAIPPKMASLYNSIRRIFRKGEVKMPEHQRNFKRNHRLSHEN